MKRALEFCKPVPIGWCEGCHKMSAAEKMNADLVNTASVPLLQSGSSAWVPNKWAVPKTKALIFLILLGAAALVGGLSYYWFNYLERYPSTDDAYVEADLYPVNSRIMGYVNAVNVAEGDSVHKGQVIATLDESDLAFEKDFKDMKHKKAVLDYNRANTLHHSTAISDYDLENAEAAMRAAEVDLKSTDIKMKYSKIIAPADGIVAKRNLQVGQFVQPGQVFFVIVDDQKPWIKANFKETQVTNMQPGQRVKIDLDGYSNIKFSGHLEIVFPSSGAKLSILPPENATGNFTRIVQRIPVKIVFDQLQNAPVIRAGMSARVTVDTGKRDGIGKDMIAHNPEAKNVNGAR